TAGNQSNPGAGFQEEFDTEKAGEEATQQYMLFPVWSTSSSNPQNKEGDAAFDGKEHDAKKPESAVNLSPSSSALSGEQDDMTKKKDKGKSHVEYFTGNRDFNEDFEDYSKDNSNNVSVAGPIVPTAGQNYSNNINPISVVEADFNNLETSITVSPIPTTRTHKDHPVSQIISDLSSTTQTRTYASFMGYMVYQMDVKSAFLYGTIEEEVYVCQPLGFEDLDHPDKVYKVYKALYGLHQAPKACQDKYVAEILKKFGLTKGKPASTPIDTEIPLLKDPDGKDVDVHIYRIQALVDKKKVVVTEAAIRDALHLDNAEGVYCLPNEDIFTTLDCMGYKKPSIKLTFYKAFFSSQWKFLIHTILQSMRVKRTSWNKFSSVMASAGDLLVYRSRVGKGCTGVETPLFEGMLVARESEEQGDVEEPSNDNNAAKDPVTAVLEDDVDDQSIS
nr:ribonuclease H-like domain, reverse transcriptase, RNA-dependent DNA polymerase [Tanacetum cinerariifolium]